MPAVTSTDAVRPGHFGLTVPDHWARFDLSDVPITRARRKLLKNATDPVTRMQIDDLVRQALALNQAARRNGALWGAGTATMYDDLLFMGHVMVFAVSTGPDVSQSDVPSLVSQLSRSDPADGATSESGADRVVATVELPRAGEAARITGTEEVTVTDDATMKMLTMSTLIPVPSTASQFMLVTCCSPNLPLAEEVYELFDAITSTFYFVAPDRSKNGSRLG